MEMQTPEQEEKRINEDEAAELLKIKLWKLQEMCRAKEVPFGKIGRERYFYRSQLAKWLKDRVVQPRPPRNRD